MTTNEHHKLSRPNHLHPILNRRTGTLALLGLMALSLLLALPGMPSAVRAIERVSPLWIAAAVALELASDISFVVIYRLFFDRLDARDARALGWTSQAAGALLPGGGVGGYAVSGWLTRLTGQPTSWVVRRSSALFFLTSGINAAAVIIPGALLLAGVAGPHEFLLAGLPMLLAVGALGYLANTVPIPGGIGVLDAGLTGALVLYGASPIHAAAAVLLYHAIALWVPGLGGSYAYLRPRPRLVQIGVVSRWTAPEALTPATTPAEAWS